MTITYWVIGGKGHILTGGFHTEEEAKKYSAFYPGSKIKGVEKKLSDAVMIESAEEKKNEI